MAPKTAAIDGGTISYLEGGKGEPILLLHGLFAQKEQWMEVGCALAIEGFDVIIPDLPGYGASSGYAISTYALESHKDTCALEELFRASLYLSIFDCFLLNRS